MKVHEQRLLKIPVDELRALLKRTHGVDLDGVEPYLDKEFVVFALDTASDTPGAAQVRSQAQVAQGRPRQRRRRKKRNRIRTRGWRIVSKITNSKGLSANIYEPFVRALSAKALPKTEQRKIVRQIMIDNGNRPADESVEYFLENTLEYLTAQK